MIVYDSLWKTLEEKGITQYRLIKYYGVSAGQLDRLRRGGGVNTNTLNRLCEILDCNIGDIATYVKD